MNYLRTIRRIPDRIILAIASRDVIPSSPTSCICGWAIRESLARASNMDAEKIDAYTRVDSVVDACADRFGGTWEEWDAVFRGIAGVEAPLIEEAFVDRVMEAAGVA